MMSALFHFFATFPVSTEHAMTSYIDQINYCPHSPKICPGIPSELNAFLSSEFVMISFFSSGFIRNFFLEVYIHQFTHFLLALHTLHFHSLVYLCFPFITEFIYLEDGVGSYLKLPTIFILHLFSSSPLIVRYPTSCQLIFFPIFLLVSYFFYASSFLPFCLLN